MAMIYYQDISVLNEDKTSKSSDYVLGKFETNLLMNDINNKKSSLIPLSGVGYIDQITP